MPPVIVQKAENYTQDLHRNLPSDWLVHSTPSGYMDRDGRMKEISLFSRICGARKLHTQVLFLDGHGSHFDDRVHTYSAIPSHLPIFLKAGDSNNYQTNDNGPNLKLKRYYSIVKNEMSETAWNHEV